MDTHGYAFLQHSSSQVYQIVFDFSEVESKTYIINYKENTVINKESAISFATHRVDQANGRLLVLLIQRRKH